jgi:hypothetical protein
MNAVFGVVVPRQQAEGGAEVCKAGPSSARKLEGIIQVGTKSSENGRVGVHGENRSRN